MIGLPCKSKYIFLKIVFKISFSIMKERSTTLLSYSFLCLPFSLSQIHTTKEVYEAKNIVNTSLFNGSPLVSTFKFVAMYILF